MVSWLKCCWVIAPLFIFTAFLKSFAKHHVNNHFGPDQKNTKDLEAESVYVYAVDNKNHFLMKNNIM